MSRCVVCGKPIEAGQIVASVQKGSVSADGEFSPKKAWGMAHFEPCFERAIDSPQMVLERVKRLAKAKNKIGAEAK